MTEIIDKEIPKGKVYKGSAFWSAIFLGGPLAAGYLFAENFKVLGQKEKVRPTWIISILTTIVIFGSVLFIPDDVEVPNNIIPIIYTGIAYLIFSMHQSEKVTQHIDAGGLVHEWGRVFGIGIISLLVTVSTLFAAIYVFDQEEFATKMYGTTVQHQIDFDRNNITENEIDAIAEGFKEVDFFDRSVAKYVYIVKNESTYEFYVSVFKGVEKDSEMLQYFRDLRSLIDGYFPKNKIEVKLVVDSIDNIVMTFK